jgi:hypothetical protein
VQIHWVPNWSRHFNDREGLYLPVPQDLRDSKKRFGLDGSSGMITLAVEINPKVPVGIPRIIANTVPVGTDSLWINERAL